MVVRLFGLRRQKTREAFYPPLATMGGKKWLPALVLIFLFLSDFILPVRGWAQSFSDTGNFYFTGAHNPLRRPIFQEFMTGPGVKAGPVWLHPSLGVAQGYTDNVFRTKTDRRSDYLTTIAPGLQALLPLGSKQHSLLLNYRAGQFLYKNFSENNAFTQDAQGHVSLNFPSGLTMDLQGGRLDGFDQRGSALDIQTRDITRWRIMSLMSRIGYSGPRAGISLSSSYQDWHYKNNDQAPRRDRKSANAALTLSANVTPSTSALLGFNIGNHTYDTNKQLDSFSYGVFSGFRLAEGRRLSGEFSIGYTILNFDRAPVEQPPGSDLSDGGDQQKFISIQGNLFWNPTSRLSISASPFRRIRQAGFQSGFTGTSTFLETGILISGRQTLTDRTALRGQFAWIQSDFDEGRKDNQFRWRMGLEYRTMKWLGFRLDYVFDKRNSNEDFATFYSNSAILSVEVLL
jgi:hypothetical protein